MIMMDNWPGIFKESNQSIAAKLLNKASRVVFHWVLHDANIFPCRQSGGEMFYSRSASCKHLKWKLDE